MPKNNLHEGHRQRLMTRLLKSGPNVDSIMQDHELLELLLFFSLPRVNTNEIAHQLIQTFGSLRNVFQASYNELLYVQGIGKQSAILIRTVSEIFRRCLREEDLHGPTIRLDTITGLVPYLHRLFACCSKERVYLLLFDGAKNLIAEELLSEGTVNSTSFSPIKCVQLASQKNAGYAVLAHNHPSGICTPSFDDIEITRTLYQSLQCAGVLLAEHIIITEESYTPILTRYPEQFPEIYHKSHGHTP